MCYNYITHHRNHSDTFKHATLSNILGYSYHYFFIYLLFLSIIELIQKKIYLTKQ